MVAQRKPWQNIQDQLNTLQSRGMIITDQVKAERYLANINYYRLSGYWHSFKKIKDGVFLDEFVNNTHFSDVIDLYVFDKKLRIILLDAIERVEVAIRTRICYVLGKYSPIAHLDPNNFNNSFARKSNLKGYTNYDEWLTRYEDLIKRSRSEFIRHNEIKYGKDLSVWVACEVWDFGTLSHLYKGLKNQDQLVISNNFGVTSGKVFASWIRVINDIRNMCSHHDRLWNNILKNQPLYDNSLSYLDKMKSKPNQYNHYISRTFIIIVILSKLVKIINPNSTWIQRINKLIQEFPAHKNAGIRISEMGAPEDWESILR